MAFEDFIPRNLLKALEDIKNIPGYGEKNASRFVYGFLKLDEIKKESIVKSLENLFSIRQCKECNILTDQEVCAICSNPKRSKKYIAVVEESQDAYKIEKLERFKGVYHILGGRISPLEGIAPEDLSIELLKERIKKYNPKEIIIATNPNPEGEATANYLIRILKHYNVKITRIATAIQFGTLIEYVDDLSLEESIERRE
ncbi:MAG: recombination protein RecR [Hydrogenobaculum sp.]|nr:MAG: recombination protein RecR [Hydrogenobaculum sp.]